MESEERTPTLNQLWANIKQLQQDIAKLKNQSNEERTLRIHLQELLMGHLKSQKDADKLC